MKQTNPFLQLLQVLGDIVSTVFDFIYDVLTVLNEVNRQQDNTGDYYADHYYLPEKSLFGDGKYAPGIAILVALVVEVDGKTQDEELQEVEKYFLRNFGKKESKILLHQVANNKEKNVAKVGKYISQRLGYGSRIHLLNFLYRIARADREVKIVEAKLLTEIGKAIGLNLNARNMVKKRFEKYFERHQAQSSNQKKQPPRYHKATVSSTNYTTLGIPSNSSMREVKKAYRTLAKQYHPDKFAHLGEDEMAKAEDKFQEINEAYEAIKKKLGQ